MPLSPLPRAADSGDEAPDVVCVGETMAVLGPYDDHPLAGQSTVRLAIGGAESNVACALAGLGHRAAWLSRLGDDPFGHRILVELNTRGVCVAGVETDKERPTGVYFKDPGPHGTRTYYYRSASAATRMGPELTRLPTLREARVVHLSGITAALSETCAQLLEAIVARRALGRPAEGGPLVSFDVNHRPTLWATRPAEAGPRLLALARAADLVFVGRDEAETLWGTGTPADVAELIGAGPVVVVKDAGHGATSYADGTATHVPALPVEVVEPVGAGDAFAAGYLAGLLEGRAERHRLRLGHLAAAAALRTRDDVPLMPTRQETEHHLTADDAAWATPAPR
ncbi:carbohydrate kinase [Streptomyces minutiscleroticus]|uniref:Carbohydrate kinase n=1 Tax=Streptomyces minutiscleroticus TaxID=68238 RepID=A0A918U9Y0_9ACTN|nr:sugar kinase [Streptomyces minutiscleroticus]GGY16154.1 carbohydrate kinase [Streptomyces minutiscleroticus]